MRGWLSLLAYSKIPLSCERKASILVINSIINRTISLKDVTNQWIKDRYINKNVLYSSPEGRARSHILDCYINC
jgi:hypothetical protein